MSHSGFLLPPPSALGYMRSYWTSQPPLYPIKTAKLQHWVYSEQEKEEVQRYKGLREMNAEQLRETTMNPSTRTLLSVSVDDAAKADQIFHMLVGDEVLPRKAFIQAHAKSVKNLHI